MSSIIDSLQSYLTNEELWISLTEKALKIIVILVATEIIIRVVKTAVHHFFILRDKSPLRTIERREQTLKKLVDNALSYVIHFIALIMILDIFGVNVGAIIAGAGVLGLAIGFGAQSLVKDVITGFFIIIEDQFAVGDYVKIDSHEGTVLQIGLRTTRLKNFSGEVHIIPNGLISAVINSSLSNSMAVVDVSISHESDIEDIEKLLLDFLPSLKEKSDEMVTEPQLLGVQTLSASEIVLRIACETKPTCSGSVARVIRKEVKKYLDENQVEVPFPRLVLYNKKEDFNVMR